MISDAISTSHQAVNIAYEACEFARREGGNRVHLHAAAEESEGEGSNWKTRLEDALAGDGFDLVYQPLVSLTGGQEERYEARVRLHEEGDQPLGPGEFLHFAESAGLAPAIDRWVVAHVVATVAERQRAGKETTVFLKISGNTLDDAEFLPHVAEQLREHDVQGSRLVFELNEPVAVTQLNQAKAFFRGITELRCGFALDQFGSGLNSFQLIKHLPAEYLKLDRTLVSDLNKSEETREKLKEIVENAHSLRRQIIAGYLEEATVLAMLWQYQVDLVQGHFLQEPQPEMNYDFTGMVI
jgi:EAL domain-containing protein (putative c-di-GMP-specific phosphodiesterase class I)